MPYVRRSTILLIALLCALLGGCGNKGPLVLPDKTPEQQQGKDRKKDQPASAIPAATGSTTSRQ